MLHHVDKDLCKNLALFRGGLIDELVDELGPCEDLNFFTHRDAMVPPAGALPLSKPLRNIRERHTTCR